MKKQILLTFLFFLFYGFSSGSDHFVFTKNCREAYSAMVQLRLKDARTLLLVEKKSSPGNLLSEFLENYCDFIQCVTDEDKAIYNKILLKEEPFSERWEKTADASPFRLYIMAEAKLQWGLMKAKFGDVLQAAFDLKEAYRLYSKNEKLYPTFAPNKKGLGILHTMFGLVPEELGWILKMLGYKGTVSQGLSELVNGLTQTYLFPEYRFMRTELLFVISFIHINLFHSKEDLFSIRKFLIPEQNEPLLLFARISIEMKTGNNEKALQLAQQWPADASYHPFVYMDYLKGILLLNKLDFSARRLFEKFIILYKGKNYIKSALQKIAWCYLLEGNETRYHEFIVRASCTGTQLIDEDRQAQKEALSGATPSVVLLKARLLSDGGYHKKALEILEDEKNRSMISGEHDNLEYIYRCGRTYHFLNRIPEAMKAYEKTIAEGRDKPWYFAANSAYSLGQIYEGKQDYVNARKYYKICLSMKNHEYRNSLEQKAKAGLSRIP